MSNWMIDLIGQLVPIFFTGLVGYLFAKLKAKDKTEKDAAARLASMEKGIMVLMRNELRKQHDGYMETGHITSEQLRQYIEVDDAYTGVGGNHVNTEWMEDIKELPIKG